MSLHEAGELAAEEILSDQRGGFGRFARLVRDLHPDATPAEMQFAWDTFIGRPALGVCLYEPPRPSLSKRFGGIAPK